MFIPEPSRAGAAAGGLEREGRVEEGARGAASARRLEQRVAATGRAATVDEIEGRRHPKEPRRAATLLR